MKVSKYYKHFKLFSGVLFYFGVFKILFLFSLFRVSILYANPGPYQKLFTHSCNSCMHNLELMTAHPSNPDVNFSSICVVQSWHCSYLLSDIPRGQWILTFTPLSLIEFPIQHRGLVQLLLYLSALFLWNSLPLGNSNAWQRAVYHHCHLPIFCVSGMRASSFLSCVAGESVRYFKSYELWGFLLTETMQ